MSNLNDPAIGRKVAYLFHHDRDALIMILSGITERADLVNLARAYLSALGCTDRAQQDQTFPGVLFVWQQLIKEANHAAQSPGA